MLEIVRSEFNDAFSSVSSDKVKLCTFWDKLRNCTSKT